jgi:hypothetical protein
MILLKVEYEFFDFEEPSSETRELHRQIRLQFAASAALYVSWTWQRQHGPEDATYSIAYAESPYFVDIAARILDVSGSPLWSAHIGQDVELAYAPSSSREMAFQALEVRSAKARTYIYSLGVDRVQVSDEPPR